jgi:group I intron endonuclease
MSSSGSFQAYKVTNQLNGRVYIGITRQKLRSRWMAHVSWAKCGRKGVLADAIREHGEAAFVMEHLASARTWDDLCAVELALICQERTTIWDGGYNVTQGGEGMNGYVATESHRRAISAKLKGVPKSAEQRAKLALARTGTTASPDTKAKMSAAHKGKSQSPEWVQRRMSATAGRKCSAETRAKISLARSIQKASAETKAEMSASRKGRKLNLSPEQRAAYSAAKTGLRHSAETRAKISAARRAREAAKRTQESSQERLQL